MRIAARRTRQERSAIGADAGWTAAAPHVAERAIPAHEFEALDSGRLLVHRQFSSVLQRHGIATFDALFQFSGGQCVRRVHSRSTTRIAVYDRLGWHSFYLKRHAAPPWGERVRPLLNLGRPIFGARNEWHAIISLHEAGVPTLTPVAFGEVGERSLLLTDDLRTELTLYDWARAPSAEAAGQAAGRLPDKRATIARVAGIVRRMHDAGIHHQDLFLHHILVCGEPARLDLRVIDPGRAWRHDRLSWRWIVKDLAQLNASAGRLTRADRLRFLRLYLGRPFRPLDRVLALLVALKSRRIAAHTTKHGLWPATTASRP
jgi:heptose I phosphotransferase